jgi:lipoate-protein ligase A
MHPWSVTARRGGAAHLHHLEQPATPQPSVWVQQITGPALVLGSTQADDLVDSGAAAAAGIEVCRRRTGGGLVHLDPGDCWLDVLLPTSSPLWHPDVGRAFLWLGHVWAETLRAVLGERGAVGVHHGPLVGGEAGRLICFAGIGPGEVTVDGRKVVGLSQRRWRTGVKFQCLVVSRWRPEILEPLVEPSALERAGVELATLPVGLATDRESLPASTLVERFVEHLPDPLADVAASGQAVDTGMNPA